MSGRFSANRRPHNLNRLSHEDRHRRSQRRLSRLLSLKRLVRLHPLQHQSRYRRLQHRRLPFPHLQSPSRCRRPQLQYRPHRHQHRRPLHLSLRHRLHCSAKVSGSAYSRIQRIPEKKWSWLRMPKGQNWDWPFHREPRSRFSTATCSPADGSIPSAVTSAQRVGWLKSSLNCNPDRLFALYFPSTEGADPIAALCAIMPPVHASIIVGETSQASGIHACHNL